MLYATVMANAHITLFAAQKLHNNISTVIRCLSFKDGALQL